MYQKLTIVGNVGNTPEMAYLPSGTAKTVLSVATNRTYKDSKGEHVKETTWFRVTCLGKLAEIVAQYVQKGRTILVEGRLQPDPQTGSPRIWDKKDGTKAASFEVFAEQVRFFRDGSDRSSQESQEPVQEVSEPEPQMPF